MKKHRKRKLLASILATLMFAQSFGVTASAENSGNNNVQAKGTKEWTIPSDIVTKLDFGDNQFAKNKTTETTSETGVAGSGSGGAGDSSANIQLSFETALASALGKDNVNGLRTNSAAYVDVDNGRALSVYTINADDNAKSFVDINSFTSPDGIIGDNTNLDRFLEQYVAEQNNSTNIADYENYTFAQHFQNVLRYYIAAPLQIRQNGGLNPNDLTIILNTNTGITPAGRGKKYNGVTYGQSYNPSSGTFSGSNKFEESPADGTTVLNSSSDYVNNYVLLTTNGNKNTITTNGQAALENDVNSAYAPSLNSPYRNVFNNTPEGVNEDAIILLRKVLGTKADSFDTTQRGMYTEPVYTAKEDDKYVIKKVASGSQVGNQSYSEDTLENGGKELNEMGLKLFDICTGYVDERQRIVSSIMGKYQSTMYDMCYREQKPGSHGLWYYVSGNPGHWESTGKQLTLWNPTIAKLNNACPLGHEQNAGYCTSVALLKDEELRSFMDSIGFREVLSTGKTDVFKSRGMLSGGKEVYQWLLTLSTNESASVGFSGDKTIELSSGGTVTVYIDSNGDIEKYLFKDTNISGLKKNVYYWNNLTYSLRQTVKDHGLSDRTYVLHLDNGDYEMIYGGEIDESDDTISGIDSQGHDVNKKPISIGTKVYGGAFFPANGDLYTNYNKTFIYSGEDSNGVSALYLYAEKTDGTITNTEICTFEELSNGINEKITEDTTENSEHVDTDNNNSIANGSASDLLCMRCVFNRLYDTYASYGSGSNMFYYKTAGTFDEFKIAVTYCKAVEEDLNRVYKNEDAAGTVNGVKRGKGNAFYSDAFIGICKDSQNDIKGTFNNSTEGNAGLSQDTIDKQKNAVDLGMYSPADIFDTAIAENGIYTKVSELSAPDLNNTHQKLILPSSNGLKAMLWNIWRQTGSIDSFDLDGEGIKVTKKIEGFYTWLKTTNNLMTNPVNADGTGAEYAITADKWAANGNEMLDIFENLYEMSEKLGAGNVTKFEFTPKYKFGNEDGTTKYPYLQDFLNATGTNATSADSTNSNTKKNSANSSDAIRLLTLMGLLSQGGNSKTNMMLSLYTDVSVVGYQNQTHRNEKKLGRFEWIVYYNKGSGGANVPTKYDADTTIVAHETTTQPKLPINFNEMGYYWVDVYQTISTEYSEQLTYTKTQFLADPTTKIVLWALGPTKHTETICTKVVPERILLSEGNDTPLEIQTRGDASFSISNGIIGIAFSTERVDDNYQPSNY